jgi:hypothetical protein
MLPGTGGGTEVGSDLGGGGGPVTDDCDVPVLEDAVGVVIAPEPRLDGAGLLADGAGECEPLHAASIDAAPTHASAQRRLTCTRSSPELFPHRGSGIPGTA